MRWLADAGPIMVPLAFIAGWMLRRRLTRW